jgi:uncharacterized protein with von Willebrand factor type A (vWA) domain
MLVRFFFMLRQGGLKPSLTEYLTLLDALQARVASLSVDDFYYLARATLVKDEVLFDRFDQIFAAHMEGTEALFENLLAEVPEDWLRRQAELFLSDEERARIEALGGWEALIRTLKERLAEQKSRHQGGNKWIGTGGTSPFGAYGYNPEGIRIGQHTGREGRAVKVWERREYRNLDDRVELGTRNIKLALRKLRRFAREGVADQLDLEDTIASTARNGGLLDIRMVPERHNAVKVLLFLDVGGSMDEHVRSCEELFSAVRTEFKHLEYYYFHNFIYESVWRDNRRRHAERIPTLEVIRKYGPDYKLILVGDATMSPYEIMYPGGSIEHWNDEAGEVWLRRLLHSYGHAVWLNPAPETRWAHTPTVKLTRDLMSDRMFPLTLAGMDDAISTLKRRHLPVH